MRGEAKLAYADGTRVGLYFKTKCDTPEHFVFFDCIQYCDNKIQKSSVMYFSKAHVRSLRIIEGEEMSAYMKRKFPEAGAYFREPIEEPAIPPTERVDYVGDVSIS